MIRRPTGARRGERRRRAVPVKWPHAGPARPNAAEDPRRALHRRRTARGLARAVETAGPRALAGDDPQRHGRPRGAGLHREPAHVGGTHPDVQGLPVLRRQPDGDEAAGAGRDPSPRRRIHRRPAAAAHERGGHAPVAAHAFRRRRHDAEAARGELPAHRVPAPVRPARAAHHRHVRGRRAEPHPAYRPGVLAVAARRRRPTSSTGTMRASRTAPSARCSPRS